MEQTSLQKRYINDQKAYEKALNIFIIKDLLIKTVRRSYLTLVRMAIIKK
jgi:hypothetical protein